MDAPGVFTESQYLSLIIENRTPCTVILTNGYQMHSVEITADCGNVVLMRTTDIREQMVYKHAISTIRTPKPLLLKTTEAADDDDLPF